MAMTGHGWRVQKPTTCRTADVSMLYPLSPAFRAFPPSSLRMGRPGRPGQHLRIYRLPEARSGVRPLFDCFHFTLEFFYFELNLSLARLLAFFECLLLFHIAFNEQILDIRNPGLLFRAQTVIAFHFDVLLVAPPGDLESLVGNTGKAAEFRCHECYKGIITKGLLQRDYFRSDKILFIVVYVGATSLMPGLSSTKPRMCRVFAIPGDRRSHALHE